MDNKDGVPLGMEEVTLSVMERWSSFGAVVRTCCRVDGWTPVSVRDRVLSVFWTSERKRYVIKPLAVTLGVFSNISSVRGGNGGRYSLC